MGKIIRNKIEYGGGSGDNIPVYTTEEYEQIKDTIPEGTKFIISDDYQEDTGIKYNWLKGKIINFVGDSITKGSITNQPDGKTVMDNPFPESVGKLLECTANNYGVPGSALTDYMSKDQPIVNRCGPDKINPNAAINFLMAGTNDMTNTVELGDIGSSDSKTVYGALNIIAQTWRDQFPDTICIFCSTFRKANMVHNDNFTQYEINKAIKDVAFKFGFVFFDMYNQAPMYNPEDAVLQSRWNTDSTHPNQAYVTKIFANYLANRLLSLHSDMDNEPDDYIKIYIDQTNGKDYYRGKTPDTPIKNLTKETLQYCGFRSGKKLRLVFMSDYTATSFNQLEIIGATRLVVTSNDTTSPVTITNQSFNFRGCAAVDVTKVNFDFSAVTTNYQGLITGNQSNIFFNGVTITGSGRINQYAISCNRCDLECSGLVVNSVDYIDYLVHTFASYRTNCSYTGTKGFWGTMSSITSVPTAAYPDTSKLETGATVSKW